MPPSAALFLCLASVIFLLRLDKKQAPSLTRPLWIPTLWLAYTSSRSLTQWITSTYRDPELGSPIDRAFLIVLILVTLQIIVRRRFHWPDLLRRNLPLVALFGFMFLSLAWSNIPFIAFKRFIREILAVLVGVALLTEEDPKLAIEAVMRRTFYILIPFSVLVVKYYPRYGVQYHPWSGQMMWTGVCDQKNGLGTLTSAAIFFLIWSIIRRWIRKEKPAFRYQTLVDGVIILASLWLLKGPGSYSATAVVVLAIGLLALLGLQVLKLFRKTLNPMILTALVLLIVVYGTIAPFIGRLPAADISARLGRDSSLTGRNEIWASVVPAAKNKPLLGHGFYSFSARKISRLYANAHNGYLEVILGIGFAGLLLTTLYLLSSIRRAQRELRTDYLWGSYWIGWLLMVMVNNVTESTLHSFSSLLMAVLMWLTIAHGHLQEQKGEND